MWEGWHGNFSTRGHCQEPPGSPQCHSPRVFRGFQAEKTLRFCTGGTSLFNFITVHQYETYLQLFSFLFCIFTWKRLKMEFSMLGCNIHSLYYHKSKQAHLLDIFPKRKLFSSSSSIFIDNSMIYKIYVSQV